MVSTRREPELPRVAIPRPSCRRPQALWEGGPLLDVVRDVCMPGLLSRAWNRVGQA
jgi:hypothetical protein